MTHSDTDYSLVDYIQRPNTTSYSLWEYLLSPWKRTDDEEEVEVDEDEEGNYV